MRSQVIVASLAILKILDDCCATMGKFVSIVAQQLIPTMGLSIVVKNFTDGHERAFKMFLADARA
jgi:hypothetical protein